MEDYQEKAWECLTKEEQNSLFLTLSQGLSTWKTGEILKITHYKYLELKARSEKFFKMFSDYFYLYPSLINPKAPLSERFRDYLYGCILKRLPKDEASEYAGDSSWLLKPVRNNHIINNMSNLKKSKDKWDKDLYALIMEFDRWNNFRILPRILQASSPYKRRNTKKDKIYIKYLHGIPDFKIRAMIDMYWKAGIPDKRYYVAFISDFFKEGYVVVPIKREDNIVNQITDMKIYIFEEQEDAELFGIMVKNFFEKTRDCKSGLNFWKEYRSLINRAINYNSINNMDFTCETLDSAYNLKRMPLPDIMRGKHLKNL